MKHFILFFAIVFFYGCSFKPTPTSSQVFNLTLISPMIKINDIVFLHKHKKGLNLQIYNTALNIANIKVYNKICINSACFEKTEFNKRFFLNSYYDDMFEDILLQKPIYNRKNLQKTECGFNQNINNNLIQYEVCANNVKFIDTKNKIKIILRENK